MTAAPASAHLTASGLSTVAHVGLFLIGLAVLTPEGLAGTALYVLAHAGTKAALFGLTGVLLDRYGSVDETGLHGRARELPLVGVLYGLGALALAGLPPFGTGLGKAVAEEAAARHSPWFPAVFVLVSALTGGAALRAALRVFAGLGSPPVGHDPVATSGEGEAPEVRGPHRRIPVPMVAVPAALLLAGLATGLLPPLSRALATAAAAFTDRSAYLAATLTTASPPPGTPPPSAWWTASGLALGLLSAALATALALAAVRRAPRRDPRRSPSRLHRALLHPLRRLHSGLIGDYVAWLTVGLAALLLALAALA
ncbi:proton-conducting transporter membrane subunit [Kitasatospora sp. MMS16-BH015]|uniref:proton-conducting transporter transmembrane domain-containing protein n=1 Tax=Kitasatospora sp. MMS16-BH015 TaxID=2018025 RepID=UPI000CF1F2DB